MAWRPEQSGGQQKRGGWSGGRRSREKPLYRWQDTAAVPAGDRARSRPRRGRWIVASLLALGLLSALVYLLLVSPRMTPMAVITATEYPSPIPLNPWALEDRDALAMLHNKNMTVVDVSGQWAGEGPSDFDLMPQALVSKRSRDREPVVVYISAHGIVNDRGEPCLLRSGKSIHDPASWIPLEKVLSRLQDSVPPTRSKLLILDCNRIRVNWQLGILYNSFIERVKQVVDKSHIPHLAVLTSAGPGQTNWASAELAGSAFGRYLQLGLAGAADEGAGSNGDGAVNLRELATYLQREVDAWSRFNRGESQIPVLMPEDAADFRLTWVVRAWSLQGFVDNFRGQKVADPAVPPGEIGSLWTKLSQLQERELLRYDPIACRDFEHDLLRLEELSQGGAAYSETAKRRLGELQAKISEAVGRANAAQVSRAIADHLGIVSAATWARVPFAIYTLPVGEYFGAYSGDQTKQIQSLWTALLQTSDQQDLNSIVGASAAKDVAKSLAETQLLVSLKQQQVASLWRRRPIDLHSVLKQRNTAERLAVPRRPDQAPGDERAHYAVRQVMDNADAARRMAEDTLFVGEDNAPQPYELLAGQSDALYDKARQVMDDASSALQSRDTALAEAPYFGAWLCDPLASGIPERNSLIQQVNRLIGNTRDLGAAINQQMNTDDRGASSPGKQISYRELASAVRADLQQLKDKFAADVTSLSNGGAQGARGWRALEAALAMPLIPGETRSKLLSDRSRVSQELFRKYFEPSAQASAVENPGAAYLDVLFGWSAPPLVEVMRTAGLTDGTPMPADGNGDRLGWCEVFAAQARRRLAELPSAGNTTSGASESPASDAVLKERNRLLLAEWQLRAAASLDFEPAAVAADPILDLRRFDLQQLLIWHAQRALDDFWGNASNPGEEEPYFARAAKGYFQAAEGLGGEIPFAVRDEIVRKRRLLAERLQVKGDRLQIAAAPRLLIEPANGIAISLDVTGNSRAEQYPPGVAAMHILGARQRLSDVVFQRSTADDKSFVRLPAKNGTSQKLEATIPETSNTSSMLKAVAFFRGREDASPEFPVPVLKGVLIDYEPYRYAQQQITLFGDRLQRSSIVFILDCSNSMTEKTLIEGGSGNGATMERMELAKSALNAMLRELADRNHDREGIRVGVRFMGHRLAWTRPVAEPPPAGWRPTLKLQKDYAMPIPRDLLPSQDVEVVHHLGEFDDTVAGQIRRKLDSVVAWGQTPLYLALSQALADFDNEDRETRKSIIAITDGKNYQFEPASAEGRAPPYTSQTMLLDAWSRRHIPIHILAFDIPKSEIAEARTEYAKIARDTGGKFAEITSGRDLLNELRERLDIDGYIVRDGKQQPVNPVRDREIVPAKLNFPVVVPSDRPLPQEFSVSFRMVQPRRVLLEGGEALELFVSQSGPSQDVVAKPYDRSVVAQANLVNGSGGQPTNHVVRAHRPIRREGSVRFPVSLQIDPRLSHFTKRPVETWIEITPLTGSTPAAEPYVFYDTNLEPSTPVPVLSWTAQSWPQQADRARIRCWYKYDPTDAVQTIPWRDVLSSPTTFRGFQPVRGVAGVQLSVESMTEANGNYRVHVIERHAPESPGIDAVRVQFDTGPDIKPIRVSHQFDSKNNIATHSYFFSPEQRDLIDRSERCQIRIAAAKDVKDSALQLANGTELEVPIQDTGELFSPRATANGQ